MHKKKISKKQGFCFEDMPVMKVKKGTRVKTHHPENTFTSPEKIGIALFESLMANDTEAFIEILDSYLHVNRSQVANKAKISRSTVQNALSRNGNPTLKTLAKIVHESII